MLLQSPSPTLMLEQLSLASRRPSTEKNRSFVGIFQLFLYLADQISVEHICALVTCLSNLMEEKQQKWVVRGKGLQLLCAVLCRSARLNLTGYDLRYINFIAMG